MLVKMHMKEDVILTAQEEKERRNKVLVFMHMHINWVVLPVVDTITLNH